MVFSMMLYSQYRLRDFRYPGGGMFCARLWPSSVVASIQIRCEPAQPFLRIDFIWRAKLSNVRSSPSRAAGLVSNRGPLAGDRLPACHANQHGLEW